MKIDIEQILTISTKYALIKRTENLADQIEFKYGFSTKYTFWLLIISQQVSMNLCIVTYSESTNLCFILSRQLQIMIMLRVFDNLVIQSQFFNESTQIINIEQLCSVNIFIFSFVLQ